MNHMKTTFEDAELVDHLERQTSMQEAESEFTNNVMLLQLRNVLIDQKYIIMQKLIVRSAFGKLYNCSFDELRRQAIYQSLKSRGI